MEHVCVVFAAREKELSLLSLPALTKETATVTLQVDLSAGWAEFPEKYAVLFREGEGVLQIPLTAGTGEIPEAFYREKDPFYLYILGSNGKKRFSTNQVCGAFVERT